MASALGVKPKVLGHDRTEGEFSYLFIGAGFREEVRDILGHAHPVYGIRLRGR